MTNPWIPRQGQRILLWGADRGLGKALIGRFADSGAQVYYLDDGRLGNTSELAGERLPFDPARNPDMRNLKKTLAEWDGGLDCLVIVHQHLESGHVLTTTEDDWQSALSHNLAWPLALTQACFDALCTAQGNVLLLGSVGGPYAYDGFSSVGVAHAALHTLMRYMASEWMKKGIRVNAIASGPIDDGLVSSAMDLQRARSLPVAPDGVIGHASIEQALDAIDFYTSDRATWLTGQLVIFDGGMTLGLDFEHFLRLTDYT